MKPDLALTALDAVRREHNRGHTCTDGKWFNPNAGTRSRCATLAHVDTATEQVTRLATQVHDAAHADRHVHAVAAALVSTPLAELPPDVREGWVHMSHLAIEALAYSLETNDQLTEAARAVQARFNAGG